MKRSLPVRVILVAIALGGCGSLDTADQVHDLRLLAMQADPPEQIIALAARAPGTIPDGGLFHDAGTTPDAGTPPDAGSAEDAGLEPDAGPLDEDAGTEADAGAPDAGFGADAGEPETTDGGGPTGGASAVEPVTISALVADPRGNGRAISYQFATCAVLDSTTQRCLSTSPNYEVLATGSFTPTGISGNISTTFTPSGVLLEAVLANSPFRGLDGINLPVQISISAGTESVIGSKLVVFAAPSNPPQAADQNPVMPPIELDGTVWGEHDNPIISGTGSHTIIPMQPDGGLVYDETTFTGSTIQLTEEWEYNFYATGGTFDSTNTGGTSNATGGPRPLEDDWSPSPAPSPTLFSCASCAGNGAACTSDSSCCSGLSCEAGHCGAFCVPSGNPCTSGETCCSGADSCQSGYCAGEVTFWIVVRDGRGGETWVSRQAQFSP